MFRGAAIRDSAGMIETRHPPLPRQAALMSVALPASGDQPPEWVHLLPAAAGRIDTRDRRGPYFVRDAQALIAASFADAPELVIDENHATDLTPGSPAPARGYIVGMEARDDGIWGRVRWTRSGRDLLADQAYRGISPVFEHSEAKVVTRLLRASLVNNPNLRGLAALHQESRVTTFVQQLADRLGLHAAATEDEILAALPAATTGGPALQAALPDLARALGLDAAADVAAVVTAARAAGTDARTVVPALQAQVATLSAELQAIRQATHQARAEAFIDEAIRAGRIGLSAANRAEFVAMHLENPERTERIVNGFAVLPQQTHTRTAPPATASALSAEQIVARARALQAAEQAKGRELAYADAVIMVSEGKS